MGEAVRTPRYEVLASGYQFVEAPRSDERGTIWFSDLTRGGVYQRLQGGDIRQFLPGRKWVGGIVLCHDGSVLCSGRGGIVRLDEATGTTGPVLTELNGLDAVNDIEADASGRLYGGTIDFAAILERGEKPRPGVLFRIDFDGTFSVVREGVLATNGVAFSPDGRLLYHSETLRGVWAYDIGADGWPRNPRLFAELEDSDGLVVDVEGGVWVARWQSGEIVRYRADATVDTRWRLPPYPYLISLAFGGADLQDLIVATGGPPARGAPLHGAILRVRSEVPGLAAARARV